MEGSSNYDIDSYINKNFKTAWCFTGFYGEPKTTKHCEDWNDLRFLSIIQIPYGFVQGILMKLLSKEKSWVELCKVIIMSNILGK